MLCTGCSRKSKKSKMAHSICKYSYVLVAGLLNACALLVRSRRLRRRFSMIRVRGRGLSRGQSIFSPEPAPVCVCVFVSRGGGVESTRFSSFTSSPPLLLPSSPPPSIVLHSFVPQWLLLTNAFVRQCPLPANTPPPQVVAPRSSKLRRQGSRAETRRRPRATPGGEWRGRRRRKARLQKVTGSG